MKKIQEVIDRISILECPTGEVENRVTEILEDYGVAEKNEVNVNRDKSYDRDEAEAYRVDIVGEDQAIIVLAESGMDDYVAQVVNVYSK